MVTTNPLCVQNQTCTLGPDDILIPALESGLYSEGLFNLALEVKNEVRDIRFGGGKLPEDLRGISENDFMIMRTMQQDIPGFRSVGPVTYAATLRGLIDKVVEESMVSKSS
ncbi:hypothetical protein [Enterobacter sp. 22466]|uniref:hypothetical protein n=1 Tax=Enterobacter sp. 22466 TaxID=3453924 RepID=UPI003F829F06